MEGDATIVIPQRGRAELTVAVVRALRRFERQLWPIIVVDDGSATDAAHAVERACQDVCVLQQRHLGVTAAWNRGLRAVTTSFAVLLNNDVTISGAWVDALVAPLREETVVLSGVELRRECAVPAAVLERVGRNEFAAGWCWAFRAEDVHAIGGFDASLRFYFSDTDVQARLLQLETVAPIAIAKGLPLRHAGHRSMQSLPDRRALWEQDRQRFIDKWTLDSR
ncbi:MAG: glycosyltransferase [Planctomycetaceae bacterium]